MSINDIVIIALIILSTISGLVSGFAKKTSKIVSLAGAGLICFYLGGTISKVLIDTVDSVSSWVEANPWGSGLVLAGAYVVTFLLSYIILRIVMKLIGGVLNNTGFIGRFLDKTLGLVAGICIGFVLADVYVWVLFGLSGVSSDIATWVINDAKLALDSVNSLTGAIMNFNLNTIGATFPGLV